MFFGTKHGNKKSPLQTQILCLQRTEYRGATSSWKNKFFPLIAGNDTILLDPLTAVTGLPYFIQETTHKSIHPLISYRFSPNPALCDGSKKITTLNHRFYYSFKKTQKGPSSKGRGTRGTTLIS